MSCRRFVLALEPARLSIRLAEHLAIHPKAQLDLAFEPVLEGGLRICLFELWIAAS